MRSLSTLVLLVSLGAHAEYPELEYNYTPPVYKDSYSGGMCRTIAVPTMSVTLKHKETMLSAATRLKVLSPSGGTIYVPYGNTVQCDSLRLTKKLHFKDGISINGVSEKGKQPRFYCRADDKTKDYHLGGTIPFKEVSPYWLLLAKGVKHDLRVYNIHVDGYKGAMRLGNSSITTITNSWFHHGPHNGISSTNINIGDGGTQTNPKVSRLYFCGSEISHYGQGNHTHNFYMHRALEQTYASTLVYIVDSLVHSPGWASAFKSISETNLLLNNKFYSTLKTDPSFIMTGKHAQMLIDIPACSTNYIIGNELYNFKPSKKEGGSAVVGLRGRRTAMRGCSTPIVWNPYNNNGETPHALNIDDLIHTDKWWTDKNNKIDFPTYVINNLVQTSGPYSFRPAAFEMYGTGWVYEGPKKVNCLLDTPDTWYDRSEVLFYGNTLVGFKKDREYVSVLRTHNDKCFNKNPTGPGHAVRYRIIK